MNNFMGIAANAMPGINQGLAVRKFADQMKPPATGIEPTPGRVIPPPQQQPMPMPEQQQPNISPLLMRAMLAGGGGQAPSWMPQNTPWPGR